MFHLIGFSLRSYHLSSLVTSSNCSLQCVFLVLHWLWNGGYTNWLYKCEEIARRSRWGYPLRYRRRHDLPRGKKQVKLLFLLLWTVWNCTVCKEIIIIPLYKTIIHIFRDHVCYLHCRLKESLDCGSRMILRNGVYALTGTAHNHGAETQELRRIALVNECVTTAAAQPGNLSDIFREIHRNRYNLKCCFVNIHYLICLTCSFLTW